jgi:rhodanese-related sulfurtransferase
MIQRTHAAAEIAVAVRVILIKMNTRITTIALLLFVIGFVGCLTAQQTTNDSAVISVQDAHERLMKDTTIVLLDVRTLEERTDERIGNTPWIPVQELEQRVHELDSLKDRTIIVYCRSGHRSDIATTLLRKKGFNALSMQGGLNQWKSEHFETTNGPLR